jgi:hypothetical protein
MPTKPTRVYTPNEFSIDASFARKFGENFSLGLTCVISIPILATGPLYLARASKLQGG